MNKLYDSLTTEQISVLQATEQTKQHAINDIIISIGDRNRDMMVIESGEVSIITIDNSGNELIIATLAQGDIIGEMNFVIPLRRTATIKAKTPTTIISYPYNELCQLIQKEPLLGARLLKTINKLLSEKLYKTLLQLSR
ncbi:MAG TPA: cyclic nucleotide-binding domain-containing protein [Candidatus Cloacimonadota bacterium]|nr:cyclic nucleotide-binding domain-containing protein [Candidatus Cloacimonadota bacterium]HQB41565.1 cyclic nucleotide-binding domain-containing protein [Candidatus Cloacimonadota bacterium]